MPDHNDQRQRVGAGGLAVQAAGSVQFHNHYGISIADVKAIALELWEKEAPRLTRIAETQAQERAARIRQNAVDAIATENPEGIQQAADVDFQHALLSIQRDYARSGDDNLGSVLVRLLVDRSRQPERNLPQLILNEALGTVSKLTFEQIRTLSLVFAIRFSPLVDVPTPADFLDRLDRVYRQFADLKTSVASIQHMDYAGCGSIGQGAISLNDSLKARYRGLFQSAFFPSEKTIDKFAHFEEFGLLRPSFHERDRFEINATNDAELALKLEGADRETARHAQVLLAQNTWSDHTIKDWIVRKRPYMDLLFQLWDHGNLSHFNLSRVGMVIGHANLKRLDPTVGSIDHWIT